MSIRTINGLSGSTNVYVNSMFADGEAIEVVQTSNTTQAKINVAMKSNTDETTTLNADDWMIIADNATGKVIKRILVSNMKNEATWWTLNSVSLYPDSTSYNLLVGTTTNSNSRKFLCSGTGEFTGVLHLGSTINSLTLPTGTKTLATLTGTEVFTNKTLSTNSNWQGNVVAYNYGGTAQSSWTKGQILYADNNNSLAKLDIGTTGQVLKVASGLPSWGTDNDTNYFTKVGSNIYPTNTSENFLVGTSSNGVNAKLYVDGDTYLVGDEIVITGEKNSTGSASTSFTLNGKSYDATSGNMTAYTEMIKLVNPQKSGASDKDPTMQLKAGHLELRGTETEGSTRTDCFSINALQWGGSSFSDYDDIINILNPEGQGSASYPKLQMKLENTNGSNGQVLTVNASGHCSWQTPTTSQWTLSSSSLYPLSTATNVLVGTTSNSSSRKIMCNGAFEATGIVVGSFSGANSFSFINGAFYNDANKTLYLDHNANQYGYGQRGIDSGGSTYSDVYTYTQSSGTAISSIGSYSNCRFALFSNQIDFLCSVPTSRGWITMGQAIAVTDSHTPLAQLHIENDLSNMNSGDTRILIKSKSSSHDSSLVLSVNENSDGSGSYVEGEVYVDSGGDLYLRGANVKVVNNSATEFVRFDRSIVAYSGADVLISRTPALQETNFTYTSTTPLRLQGGTSFSGTSGWGSTGGEYQMMCVNPPNATNGPWSLFCEDSSTSVSLLGWFFGSSLQMYMTNSGSNYSRTAWATSDNRIKTNITTEGVNQKCYDIVKRIPAKEYNYKQELINSTLDYTAEPVIGWIAQDWYNDSEVNYLSTVEPKPRKYYNDNNELLLEVKDCLNIRKADIGSITYGAVGRLIELVETQQAKITTLEDELESIKVILENNNLV